MKPLTIITKNSILDVAAVLDPPLDCGLNFFVLDKIVTGASKLWLASCSKQLNFGS